MKYSCETLDLRKGKDPSSFEIVQKAVTCREILKGVFSIEEVDKEVVP